MAGDDGYTTLLLHLNGADAAVTTVDECGHAITFVGTAQLDTADKKFGTASLLLDGNSDYIYAADSADFEPGAGNFTIDFWYKASAVSGFFQKHTSGVYDEYMLLNVGSKFTFRATVTSIWEISFQTAGNIPLNAWTHFAIVRNGNVYTMYVNGTADGTQTVAGTIKAAANRLEIGHDIEGGTDGWLNGWIDEFRFSKGIARWTANFTPPTSEYGMGGGGIRYF